MVIDGIDFDMNWHEGTSPRESLPRNFGIYCEVYWTVRGIRIGEAENIWKRHGGHLSWMRSIKEKKCNKPRYGKPLADHARDWGTQGVEAFVLSTDSRLHDKNVRIYYETELHKWAENQVGWKNFNGEKWVPSNYGIPVIDEIASAEKFDIALEWTFKSR